MEFFKEADVSTKRREFDSLSIIMLTSKSIAFKQGTLDEGLNNG